MITLDKVSKSYGKWTQQTTVLDKVSAVFQPRTQYVILGQRGSGKSTLLRVLAGVQRPSSGSIDRTGVVAPPIGSQSVLTLGKSPRSIISFCADYYRVDFAELLHFVTDFSDLKDDLDTSISVLPPAERVALAYAVGYGVPADFYLIDGAIANGTEAIRRRCQAAFEERRATASTIFATYSSRNAEKYGDRVAILEDGKLQIYEEVQEALDAYAAIELDARQGALSAAEVMVRQGDLANAQTYLEEYVTINPGDIAGYKLLASVALRTQNFAIAKSALQSLIEFDPEDSNAYLALARAAQRDEDWNTAAAALTTFLVLEPGDTSARTALARCLERDGQAQGAARMWTRIFADSDALPEATTAIRSCIRLEDWNSAFRMIDHAVDRWPHDVPLLTMAAQTSLQLARQEDFSNAIEQMVEVDPGKAMTLTSRSLAQLDWQTVVGLLGRLRDHGLLDEVPELVRKIMAWLERQARAADQNERTAEAREIRVHIESFKGPADKELADNNPADKAPDDKVLDDQVLADA